MASDHRGCGQAASWALLKRYAAHGVIVLIALVAFSVHSFELPINGSTSFVLDTPTIDLGARISRPGHDAAVRDWAAAERARSPP